MHLKDLYTRFLDVAMLFGAGFVHVSAWYLNLKKIFKKIYVEQWFLSPDCKAVFPCVRKGPGINAI